MSKKEVNVTCYKVLREVSPGRYTGVFMKDTSPLMIGRVHSNGEGYYTYLTILEAMQLYNKVLSNRHRHRIQPVLARCTGGSLINIIPENRSYHTDPAFAAVFDCLRIDSIATPPLITYGKVTYPDIINTLINWEPCVEK